MPSNLSAITGGLYCSGGNTDNTTDSINGQALTSVASDPSEPTTGGVGFVIVDYPTLTSLTFPDLTTVGSNFIIARNPKLLTIDFRSLKSVTGNVDITGNIQILELPSLALVNGSVNIQTSLASFVCPLFETVVILGEYACSVGLNFPEPLPVDDPDTDPAAINVISASIPVPWSSMISASSTSTQSASSSTSRNSGSSASAAVTTSSASPKRFSGIVFWIGLTQVLCLFFW